MAESRYSIVIPSYNRRDTLLLVLELLARQDAPELLSEVLIVDDGSSDGAPEAVEQRRWSMPVRVVRQARGGPAAARNRGVAEANAELILFLCDDVEATPSLLRLHEERRQGVQGPHCVTGRVDWPPGRRVTPFMRFVIEDYHFGFERLAGLSELPFSGFITANLSIHRALLEEAGGFDTRFPYGFEDTDLGLRLVREHGARVLYAPEALGLHHHRIDIATYCRRQEALGASALVFAAKHPEDAHVTRLDRAPSWRTPLGIAKRLARNRLTTPLLSVCTQAAFGLGGGRLGRALCHQLLAYHYYRGIERAAEASAGAAERLETPS